MDTPANTLPARNKCAAFGGGALIGALGGLIGLGGAEFRLPLLIGIFQFAALEAVILNKAISLVVVATALPFRAATVPFDAIGTNWPIVVSDFRRVAHSAPNLAPIRLPAYQRRLSRLHREARGPIT